MGRDSQYQLRSGRNRLWPACPVLCDRRLFLGSVFSGTAKTGICSASLYPLCTGKGSRWTRHGADDRDLFYLRQRRIRIHEQHRRQCHDHSSAPCRDRQRNRGRRLFAEHPVMAGVLSWKPAHYSPVLYPDPHSVRAVFQAVYLYGDLPAALCVLCRREHRRDRESLCEVLHRRLPGGCRDRAGLSNLLGLPVQRIACCGQQPARRDNGLGIHRGACFQYAGADRPCERRGSDRPGNVQPIKTFRSVAPGCFGDARFVQVS